MRWSELVLCGGVTLLPMIVSGAEQQNDFPTMARVDYVLTCMREHGGQTLDNLYSCTCEVDAIAEQMHFSDYEEATTFAAMRNMPGERGGIYRQSQSGEKLVNGLKENKAKANAKCFLGPRAGKPKPTGGTSGNANKEDKRKE